MIYLKKNNFNKNEKILLSVVLTIGYIDYYTINSGCVGVRQ